MPTKPRTKKPAAKPQRNAKKPRQSASEIRQRIQARYDADETGAVKAVAEAMAKALGRDLDDLLGVKQGTPVDAWQATERDERIVAGIVAGYASRDEQAQRTSPIEEAVTRLLQAVSAAECVTDTTVDRLQDVLSPPSQPTPPPISTDPIGASELVSRLHVIADRIFADGRRRLDILNRLEL